MKNGQGTLEKRVINNISEQVITNSGTDPKQQPKSILILKDFFLEKMLGINLQPIIETN